MKYLQGIFTNLWSIWTHRNLVVHEGKHPNPLEVILTVQSLICRYAKAFDCCSTSVHKSGVQSKQVQIPCGPWQLIVKVVGARLKRMNRAGYAFEAKTTHGNSILQGIYSCTKQPIPIIIQGAMLEVALKAKELGFKHILFLSDCRKVVQVNNCKITSSWQEKSLMSNWSYLLANDFVYHFVFVLKVVTSCVFALAKLATKMPIHSCYVNTNLLQCFLFSGMVSKKNIYIYIYDLDFEIFIFSM